MVGTFETEAHDMGALGGKVVQNAEQIGVEVEGLIGRLEGVDWKGPAADAFHAAKEDWRLQVTTIKQQLADVAERLGVNANTYNEVQIGSQTGYERLRGQNLPI